MWLFWSASLAVELEYRLNFVMAAVGSCANVAGGLFGLYLFYGSGSGLGGWAWVDALLVAGIFTILQGVSGTFLVPNLNRIVEYVQQGTLDFVLLKPTSSQFWLSLRSVSLWGIPDILLGMGLVGYAGWRSHLSVWHVLLGLLPLLCGLITLYSIWFILGATSIWFVKIYNATEVLRSLLEAGRYPISAYPVGYRFFFTFIVPVAFLTTVPAETILGRGQWLPIGIASLLAITLFWFASRFWRFALRFYTSASS
jgi:ABC-2 type transport system permease protein